MIRAAIMAAGNGQAVPVLMRSRILEYLTHIRKLKNTIQTVYILKNGARNMPPCRQKKYLQCAANYLIMKKRAKILLKHLQLPNKIIIYVVIFE